MRKLAVLIVVFALVAAACSDSSSGEVGKVGDTVITEADLGAFFESNTLPIDETLRDAIFALLAREVLLQGLRADFGAELDEEQVDTLYSDLIGQMETAGMTPEEFLGIPDASTEMIRFNAEIGVIRQQALDGRMAEPGFVDLFFSDPAAYTTVCARHILTETEEEADAVRTRLEEGEDFGTVATEVSLDSGTPGGDLGCANPSRYVTEFADATLTAPIGELFGPVQTQFGYHLIIVDDRTAPTREEVAADPRAFVGDDEANGIWTQWFNDKLQNAEVTVNPKYGSWSEVGIVPPGE